jgi:hypothetical protein
VLCTAGSLKVSRRNYLTRHDVHISEFGDREPEGWTDLCNLLTEFQEKRTHCYTVLTNINVAARLV